MDKTKIIEFKNQYLNRLTEDAKALMDKKLPELTEEKFSLTEKTGNRIIYEKDYFEVRRFLCVYGTLAIYDTVNRDKYLSKLEYVLVEICKERCWALPAHVNRKEDSNWENYVDLFASETAEALAEIVYRIGDELSETLVLTIKENIFRRVIEPYESKNPYDKWEHSDMNWNAVCNGSIGLVSLYLLNDDKSRQAKIINRVCEDLKFFIEGFGLDGTCYEGLSYFTYGMYFYLAFYSQLALCKDYGHLTSMPEKCKAIASFQQKCFFNSGVTISFSDGYMRDKYRIGLTLKLYEAFPDIVIPPIEKAAFYDFDSCYRFLMVVRDLRWMTDFINSKEQKVETSPQSCYVLEDSQWGICNGKTAGMACKGGHNDEPHNHNDVGSFLYLVEDEFLLTDLGAGEYTKQYFDDRFRYDIFCNNSFSHNLPIIDGKGQLNGREYVCDKFEFDNKGYFKYSLSKAYGNPKLKSFIRELLFDEKTDTLKVIDSFESENCLIEENLVTQENVELKEKEIIISGKNHSCRIKLEDDVKAELLVETHVNHEGVTEAVTRITWQVKDTKGKSATSCYIIEKVE